MTVLFDLTDIDDDVQDDLRAADRAERAKYRSHWCRDCLGFTQRGSPCYDGPDDDEEERE